MGTLEDDVQGRNIQCRVWRWSLRPLLSSQRERRVEREERARNNGQSIPSLSQSWEPLITSAVALANRGYAANVLGYVIKGS